MLRLVLQWFCMETRLPVKSGVAWMKPHELRRAQIGTACRRPRPSGVAKIGTFSKGL